MRVLHECACVRACVRDEKDVKNRRKGEQKKKGIYCRGKGKNKSNISHNFGELVELNYS